ncbi:hypothetical protein [Deinococcus multiflagellatus]|uniref:DUF5724 domain-containing protein n=1 Tax=Deinococcus multiflagellatus TaxID=1656887 RepID=A0ABW1ZM73_9DEIO
MSSSGKNAALWHLRRRHTPQPEEKAAPPQPLDAPTRDLLLTLLQDRVGSVAQTAVEIMAHLSPTPDEVPVLEGLLRRRGADLRRGLIRLLAADQAQGAQSAGRLLAQTNTEQRQAGLQLLREVGDAARRLQAEECHRTDPAGRADRAREPAEPARRPGPV